jgi:hypothetical protein
VSAWLDPRPPSRASYDDRSALTACLLKGRQNLGARLRVEIPCRFVGNSKVAQEIVDNMVAFAELTIE